MLLDPVHPLHKLSRRAKVAKIPGMVQIGVERLVGGEPLAQPGQVRSCEHGMVRSIY
jgi:hypothetical protein